MRKYFWHIIGTIVVILCAGYMFLVKTVAPDYIRQLLPVIEAMAPDFINGSVRIGDLRWGGGLSAEIIDVTVYDEAGGKICELPKTIVSTRPWRALGEPARALSRLELLNPRVYLVMGADGRWNMQHLMKPSDSEDTPFYGVLKAEGASLEVVTPEGSWEFGVEAMVDGGANPDFVLDAVVSCGAEKLTVSGIATAKGEGHLQVKTDSLDLEPYAPLAERYAELKRLQGGLGKTVFIYDNKDGSIRFSGRAALEEIRAFFAADGSEHSLSVSGAVEAQENLVTLGELDITADGQRLKLAATADLRDKDAPALAGLITAEALEYQGYRVTGLKLPFRADAETAVLDNAAVGYGGGRVLLNAAYGIKDRKLAADIAVDNVKKLLPGNTPLGLSGSFALVAKTEGEKLELHAGADASDLKIGGVAVEHVAFDGSYGPEGLIIDHLSMLAGEKGSFAAKGKAVPGGALAIEARMSDFPIAPFAAAAGETAEGYCSTGFNVGGTTSAPEFSGMLQFTRVRYKSLVMPEAHGLFSMKDNVLSFKRFEANMDQGRHIFSGSVDLRGEEPVCDFSLATENVRLEPLVALSGQDPKLLTGNLSNTISVRGPLSDPSATGEVHIADGSALGQLFSAVDGTYKYDGGRLELGNFLINAFYARLSFNGSMSPEQELDFELYAKDVDLAHLPVDEKSVKLGGMLNAEGHIGGTVSAPYFKGQVYSGRITVNGEELTGLKGTVGADGGKNNKFDLTFRQPYKGDLTGAGGVYAADLALDVPAKLLSGRVIADGGDIGGLLRMGAMDYNINGRLNGTVAISPRGLGSGIEAKFTSEDVRIHDLQFGFLDVAAVFKDNVLTLNTLRLQEQKGVMDRGVIGAGGWVDLNKNEFRFGMGAKKANPALATAVMKEPLDLKGELDLSVRAGGTLADPSGSGYVTITNGSIGGVSLDTLSTEFSLADDTIKISKFIGAKDVYCVEASGDIPLDALRAGEERRNPQAEMNIAVDLDKAQLGILPAMSKLIEAGSGLTHGKIRIAGTIDDPLLYGDVNITGGSVKLRGLDTVFANICLDASLEGKQIVLKELSTGLGRGRFLAAGSYALDTTMDTAYDLRLKADNVELASPLFHVVINSELEIIPESYRPRPKKPEAGSAPPRPTGPPPLLHRPKLQGTVRLDEVRVNMPTVPDMGEDSDSDYGMDVSLELGPKIHLLNSYFYDIWLEGGIHVKGSTAFPVVDGSIRAKKGTISYLRTDFKLDRAELVWVEPGSFLPNINLESHARFSNYDIFMNILGPVMEMDLQMKSDPPLEKNTIIRMLTLQRDSAGSDDVTSEDMNNLMNAGLQMTVLGDVELWVKQTLGLDQFRLYTGKVRSGIGFESAKDRNAQLTADDRNSYNVLVSKYLNERLMLGYTSSFDGIDRSIFGQYDINRRVALTYSRSWDLSKDPDDWVGVQYKVNFR